MSLTMTQARPLADLITAAHNRGMSYRDMRNRAAHYGHRISHSQLADYARGLVRNVPDRTAIEAIAAALGVEVSVVRDAVFEEFLGFKPHPVVGVTTAEEAILNAADLSAAEKRVLLATLQALRGEGRSTNGAHDVG